MRVVSTAIGFDNIVVRQPGEEFDMPEGSKGSWFKPVESRPKTIEPEGKHKKDGKDLV